MVKRVMNWSVIVVILYINITTKYFNQSEQWFLSIVSNCCCRGLINITLDCFQGNGMSRGLDWNVGRDDDTGAIRGGEFRDLAVIRFDFGFLWSVFDMNSKYQWILVNLSDLVDCNNAECKLKPDFIKNCPKYRFNFSQTLHFLISPKYGTR